jgi:hypothetical protein
MHLTNAVNYRYKHLVRLRRAFEWTRKRRGTQVAKGEVCKTFIQGFESPPRLRLFFSRTYLAADLELKSRTRI